MKPILILLSFSLLFTACQKSDTMAPDPSKVVINITSPQAGQVFHTGDTVYLQATVSYPSELHGYELKVTDTTADSLAYDLDEHIHDDHFTINDTLIYHPAQAAGMKLELTVEIDHDGHEAEKTILFGYQP